MKAPPASEATPVLTVAAGPDAGVLYELVGSLRDARLRRGWDQTGLARISGLTRPKLSAIECGRTRVSGPTAHALCDALGIELELTFRRLVTLTRAAEMCDVPRGALRAAVAAGRIRADIVETRDKKTRVYFVEENLSAQLATLPTCKAADDDCEERALHPSGYCSAHKWRAAHEKIRRAIAKPLEERLWVTEDEACRQTCRSWAVVHRAVEQSELRASRIGGCVVIPKADLEEWDAELPPALRSQAWRDESEGMVGLYEAGLSHTTIARRAKRNSKTVLDRLARHGVPRRKGGPPRKHPDPGLRKCRNPKCRRPGRLFLPDAANFARGNGHYCSKRCTAEHAWITATGFGKRAEKLPKWRSIRGGHESSRRRYTDEEAADVRALKAEHPFLGVRDLARYKGFSKDQVSRMLREPPPSGSTTLNS